MKKFRKNNKGFSLIELIIVVAIMVALIVVLAPQYLKQVEKARLSADNDIIAEITNALKVGATDEDYGITAAVITLSHGADAVVTSETCTKDSATVGAALTEYYGTNWASSSQLKSTEYKNGGTITLSTDATTKAVTVTWSATAANNNQQQSGGQNNG